MEQDPNAQGQVAPAVSAEPQTQQPAPPAVDPGIQKRIDELTARAAAAERQALETQQQMLKQQMELVAQARAPQAAPEPDLTQKYGQTVDPNVIAMMNEVTQRVQAKANAELEARTRQLRAQYGSAQIQAQASQLKGVPPEVGQRAAELFRQAQLAGSQASEDEALRYALGDWMLKQQATAAPVYGYTGRSMMPSEAPLTAPNYIPPRQAKGPPANFESMSLEEQIAQMERDGVADRGFGE